MLKPGASAPRLIRTTRTLNFDRPLEQASTKQKYKEAVGQTSRFGERYVARLVPSEIAAKEESVTTTNRQPAGITPHILTLRGVVHIDTEKDGAGHGSPGILIFVFLGESAFQSPIATVEGKAEWIPLAQVDALPAVDDLSDLLTRALAGGDLFYGRYLPQPDGTLTRDFS